MYYHVIITTIVLKCQPGFGQQTCCPCQSPPTLNPIHTLSNQPPFPPTAHPLHLATPPPNPQPTTSPSASTVAPGHCLYRGISYSQGQQWYDGCELICRCGDAAKGGYMCTQRCASYMLPTSPHCRMVPDPKDPICCQVPSCSMVQTPVPPLGPGQSSTNPFLNTFPKPLPARTFTGLANKQSTSPRGTSGNLLTTFTPTPLSCIIGLQTIPSCEWSEWEPWDCSLCCPYGASTYRTRQLCCSGTLWPSDRQKCYSDCNKDMQDADEDDWCSSVCGSCSTSTTYSTGTTSTTGSTGSTTTTDSTGTTTTTGSTGSTTTTVTTTTVPSQTTATLGAQQTITKSDPSDCIMDSQTFRTCQFSDWTTWDCSTCCTHNSWVTRSRKLCCSGTFNSVDQKQCYIACNKNYQTDRFDHQMCSSVCSNPLIAASASPKVTLNTATQKSTLGCPCPTSTLNGPAVTTSTNPSTVNTNLAPLPKSSPVNLPTTGKSTTSNPSSTVTATSPTLPPSTSTLSNLLTLLTPAATMTTSARLCYTAEEDVYHCGTRCRDAGNWDECVRTCSKDLYTTVCKLVSLSLFILGMIVGVVVMYVANRILKWRQQHARSRVVSPESMGPVDNDLTSDKNNVDGVKYEDDVDSAYGRDNSICIEDVEDDGECEIRVNNENLKMV